MIATPCQRNRAHAEVEGEDMDPTKEPIYARAERTK
jgi:hypothetical protein